MSLRPSWLTNVSVVATAGLAVFAASLASGETGTTMAEAGVSIEDLQSAGTPAKAVAAHDGLGSEGREAAWWFLLFELPYLTGFGIPLSAGCAFAAARLDRSGPPALARAHAAIPLGFLAAACDLAQNLGVASPSSIAPGSRRPGSLSSAVPSPGSSVLPLALSSSLGWQPASASG